MRSRFGAAVVVAAMATSIGGPVWAVSGPGQLGAMDIARNCAVFDNKSPEEIASNCTKVIVSTAWRDAPWPYFDRAIAYIKLGHRDSALADLNMAAKLSPENEPNLWAVYNNRCLLRAEAGKDLHLALDDCNKSHALRPDNTNVLDSRALVEYRMANYAAAVADCNAVLARKSDMTSCLYVRGLSRLKAGDIAGGNADIASVRKSDPTLIRRFASFGVGR